MDLSPELTSRLTLAGFSKLLDGETSLEDGLQEWATFTAQFLKAQGCSIMLLVESTKKDPKFQFFSHYEAILPLSEPDLMDLNQGVAAQVVKTGQALLICDLSQSLFAFLCPDLANNPPQGLMSVPIYLGAQVIGAMTVNGCLEHASFQGADLELLNLLALFVSKSTYISQLQTVLRSRFIEIAVLRDWEEQNKSLLHPSNLTTLTPSAIAPDPNKLAKIVAKSFFKELTQAGFDASQIIAIATEVLSLLENSLNKHKKRLARDESDSEQES